MRAIEALAAAGGLLLLAYLIEIAREKGVLFRALVVSVLALIAGLIAAGAIWFALPIELQRALYPY